MSPMSASGARTASRVPTTMSTSPARIRRHSSARSPSPRPEWTSAIRASRSARSRSTSGRASAISGTSTSAGRPPSSDVGDGLDIDGGLAAAGDPVQQQGTRVARRDRRADPLDRLELGRQQVGRRRPASTPTGRARGQRQSRSLADLGLDQAAAHETGDGSAAVVAGQVRGCLAIARAGGELRAARRSGAGRAAAPSAPTVRRVRRDGSRDRLTPRVGQADPAFVAGAGAGAQQRPFEADPTVRVERPQAAEQAGAPVRPGQVAHGLRTLLELPEEIGDDGVDRVGRAAGPRPPTLSPGPGGTSATSSSRSSRPGGNMARSTSAGGAR